MQKKDQAVKMKTIILSHDRDLERNVLLKKHCTALKESKSIRGQLKLVGGIANCGCFWKSDSCIKLTSFLFQAK